MIDLQNDIMSFLKEVTLSGNVPKCMREKALDYLLQSCTDKIKLYAIGGIPVDVEQFNRVKDAYGANKKIMAIKELRGITGVSLREAKEAVEHAIETNWEKQLNPELAK